MTSIFGGGTTGASQQSQASQAAANLATEQFIKERTAEARSDVTSLFPGAQQVASQGFQGALDLIGQGIPQQIDAFSQGNVGAQQAIANTFPQIQNAIFGLPVDQSAFQPVGINAQFPSSNLTVPTSNQTILEQIAANNDISQIGLPRPLRPTGGRR